ncbi:MAG: D-alanyl-D-alanine carboxypeptidase [Lachnospiraceae bacterium]|nr:D-alanyl-D-alanine carboxypeptidase [Lachnospiraceae bacterium]
MPTKPISLLPLRVFMIINICLIILIPHLHLNATTLEQHQEAAEARKLLPIESNLIENWPAGPAIGAASAILMEANTGVILYAKNIHERQFPASTTKMMTCLLAANHANLNDIIPFSATAVNSISWDSSKIGIKAGQSLTFEQALYAAMVHSANDVTNGIAEFVGGDLETFAEMMTKKAAELGAQNTNFLNSHGLFEEEHYTTAYDLALIAAAYFRHEMLARIGNTVRYYIPPSENQPEEIYLRNRHRLINGEIAVDYNIIGGKTGFVSRSRQTLITAAEKDGMRLICVILKQESPEQFFDTVKLFDYGFSNFQIVNVAANESRYTIQNANFFQTGNDIFGDSSPLLSLNPADYLVMPKTTDFRSLAADITYYTSKTSAVAEIIYTYNNAYLGTATVDFASENRSTYDFDSQMPMEIPEPAKALEENVVFINVRQVIFIVITLAALAILFFIIRAALKSYHFNRRRKRRRKKPGLRHRRDRFKGYYL